MDSMVSVITGLENFLKDGASDISKSRWGLLCNPASINRHFLHARDLIHHKFPGRLTALFSPQHGFFAEKQDNMIESGDFTDTRLNVPVFSLYGKTRIPTPEMMDQIDVLLVDLLDVGTRVYTFTSTLSYCLEAAAGSGKRVVVLDRPNPVGGIQVEGNCLAPDLRSFVGRYEIPMRHGLTMGEYAAFINETQGIGCDLRVVPMTGWRRRMLYPDTGLPWVAPSPNLPTPASALVYPGQVIWEGTNISEGRGTTLPFEQFGAPFLDLEKILDFVGGPQIPGAVLRPVAFEPTSNKWAGQRCLGFQIHVTDSRPFSPLKTSLHLLQAVIHHHPDRFSWKQPPYEYEHEKLPMDLIIGSRAVRRQVEEMVPMDRIASAWAEEIAAYWSKAGRFCLYA